MTTRIRTRGEDIRNYIIEHLAKDQKDISSQAATHFGISRQAVNKHLQRLISEGAVKAEGNTVKRTYTLASLVEWAQTYELKKGLAEDVVWRQDISTVLGAQPENVLAIWHYAFTEMFNNAIDHSFGSQIYVHIARTAGSTRLVLKDNGVGIFKKIQAALGLADERHAILELSKGKLTTDPDRHTGQGIFFTSRMVDHFSIFSGGVHFSHDREDQDIDWIFDNKGQDVSGTIIWMSLGNHTSKTVNKIWNMYSGDDDYGFVKTVVPVRLAQYGNDRLISRSQAKRVVSRVELFKTVVFDFEDVPTIGQAFADEIFRVFANAHPEIELIPVKANSDVKRMIGAAKAAPFVADLEKQNVG
jgi:biotin operon repressor